MSDVEVFNSIYFKRENIECRHVKTFLNFS